jgi:hypothetical protein
MKAAHSPFARTIKQFTSQQASLNGSDFPFGLVAVPVFAMLFHLTGYRLTGTGSTRLIPGQGSVDKDIADHPIAPSIS